MPTSIVVPERFNAAAFFLDRHLAEGRGARTAFRYAGRTLTYQEVGLRANRLGNALAARGVDIEPRVLLALPDCPEFAEAFWGAMFYRDADDYFYFCGRADDMLKVGGIWVAPAEVEAALMEHPAVLEAAVIGKEDADGLTKPQAFCVLKDGAAGDDALRAELRETVKKRLAVYKVPRSIEFVADLPRTATGKIQRFRLRE